MIFRLQIRRDYSTERYAVWLFWQKLCLFTFSEANFPFLRIYEDDAKFLNTAFLNVIDATLGDAAAGPTKVSSCENLRSGGEVDTRDLQYQFLDVSDAILAQLRRFEEFQNCLSAQVVAQLETPELRSGLCGFASELFG